MLKQVSRRIQHFLNDHKIYKVFIFKGKDHQQTLLGHARKLTKFLKEKQPKLSQKFDTQSNDIETYLLNALSGFNASEQASIVSGGPSKYGSIGLREKSLD